MSIKYLQNDIEKIEYIKKLLVANSKDVNVKDKTALIIANDEYQKLRIEILEKKELFEFLPFILRTTDSLNTFNADIKAKFSGSGSYLKRTEYIENDFSLISSYLKGLPTQTTKDNYSKEQIKLVLKEYFEEKDYLENIYGKFILEKKSLGGGGTSTVKGFLYEGKSFAIKFLEDNIVNKESSTFRRFKQAHLNLITLQGTGAILPQIHFDCLKINSELVIPYVIMPVADNTLKKYVTDKKSQKGDNEFSFKDFNQIYLNLLNIINIIHKNQIIHRDIKPENLFIINGRLVLGDFDIAKFDEDYHIKLAETGKGDRLANFYYSSPEQSSKKFDDITEAADWFAFGQVLHWLITGDVKKGQGAISFKGLGKEYEPFEQLVEQLLLENPKERLSSKEEIEQYMNDNKSISKEESIHKFDNFINKYSLQKEAGKKVIGYDSIDKIKDISQMLSDEGESYQLQWCEGGRDSTVGKIHIVPESDDVIRFNNREIKVKSIWFYKSPYGYGGSLLVIESDDFETAVSKCDPVFDEECYFEYKGKKYPEKDFKDGWGIIEGETVQLDGTEQAIIRQLKRTIIFLGSKHQFLIGRNFDVLEHLHSKYNPEEDLKEIFFEDLKYIKRPDWIRLHD